MVRRITKYLVLGKIPQLEEDYSVLQQMQLDSEEVPLALEGLVEVSLEIQILKLIVDLELLKQIKLLNLLAKANQ